MSYIYNSSEEFIKKIYDANGIFVPSQLKPELIAEPLNLSVAYLPVRSYRVDEYIFLDSRLSKELQWQEFGHELCHALWHQTNQFHLTKPYIEYQENQAIQFAYYACVPTPMLLSMDLPELMRDAIHKIMAVFNVTFEFAQKRLELHINKMYQTSS